MKRDAIISFVALIIFITINLIGGIINDFLGNEYEYGINIVVKMIPLHIIFCCMFFCLSLINIRFRKSLRLPLLWSFFWLIMTFLVWLRNSLDAIVISEFIDLFLPAFNVLIIPIIKEFQSLEILNDLYFNLIVFGIIGMSLYQIVIFEIATLIVIKVKVLRATTIKRSDGRNGPI